MFRNYFTTAYRNIWNNKLYSLINVIGLAVGLASCALILLFVRDELSFDRFWPDHERIYRYHTTFDVPGRTPFFTVLASGPTRATLAEDLPVEASTRVAYYYTTMKRGDEVFYEIPTLVDEQFFQVFDMPLLLGDRATALADNTSIILSREMAIKHFGSPEAAMGQTFDLCCWYGASVSYRVTGVIENAPDNTHLDWDMLMLLDEGRYRDQPWMFEQWTSVNSYLYVKAVPGVSEAQLDQMLPDFVNRRTPNEGFDTLEASEIIKVDLMPLADIQLKSSHLGGQIKAVGSMNTIYVFAAIALLILGIACINFTNLATARSTQRAREVVLRKVMGASRGQLIIQFLGESVVLVGLAFLLALALVELCLPVYNGLIDKSLSFHLFSISGAQFLLLGMAVAVMGGAYPAFVLSGFRPSRVLKANRSAETSGSTLLRNALVVLQFSISIGLIIATGVVYGQMQYVKNYDLGYTTQNMLVLHGAEREGIRERQAAMVDFIRQLPEVEAVTSSNLIPTSGSENNTSVTVAGRDGMDPLLINQMNVDFGFFETYEVGLVAGRTFSEDFPSDVMESFTNEMRLAQQADPDNFQMDLRTSGVIINQSAIGRLGLGSVEEALGQVIRGGPDWAPWEASIIGVVRDIQLRSVRSEVRPFLYFKRSEVQDNVSVKFRDGTDQAELVRKVEAIWNDFAIDVPFRSVFVENIVAEQYNADQARANLFAAFAVLAIIIACLGLYGSASFTAERRTKEIGIRKVMGASIVDIVRLMVWQFSKPVLMANIIAWPVAIHFMNQWLNGFQHRLDVTVLPALCALAGLLAVMIAWGTVAGHVARVARRNPVLALRYE